MRLLQSCLQPCETLIKENTKPFDCLFSTLVSQQCVSVSQVNMLIGIVVFNKLMSRDGISDKSKKQRAG